MFISPTSEFLKNIYDTTYSGDVISRLKGPIKREGNQISDF